MNMMIVIAEEKRREERRELHRAARDRALESSTEQLRALRRQERAAQGD